MSRDVTGRRLNVAAQLCDLPGRTGARHPRHPESSAAGSSRTGWSIRTQLHRGEAPVRLSPAALDRLPHLRGRAVGDAAAAGELQSDGWVLASVPIESDSHAEAELPRDLGRSDHARTADERALALTANRPSSRCCDGRLSWT